MYTWITTRSGVSSVLSFSTCSSTMTASSSGERYAARVASPSGGKSEYLIGRQKGLVASVRAGRTNVTRRDRCAAMSLHCKVICSGPDVKPAETAVRRDRRNRRAGFLRAGDGRDCRRDSPRRRAPLVVPPDPAGPRTAPVHDPQVPPDARRKRDRDRPAAARHRPGRVAAARQCASRRTERRWAPTADGDRCPEDGLDGSYVRFPVERPAGTDGPRADSRGAIGAPHAAAGSLLYRAPELTTRRPARRLVLFGQRAGKGASPASHFTPAGYGPFHFRHQLASRRPSASHH